MSSDRISGQSTVAAQRSLSEMAAWVRKPSIPSIRSSLLMNEAVKMVMQLSFYKRKDKNKTSSIILLLLYVPMGGHRNSD